MDMQDNIRQREGQIVYIHGFVSSTVWSRDMANDKEDHKEAGGGSP
jgi:hypothetical protein